MALVLLGAPAGRAQGPDTTALSADIAALPLDEALAAFSRQTNLHVVYVSQIVRDRSSHAVAAGLPADKALARMLQGTGLRFEFLTAHSVRILAAPPDPPPPLTDMVPPLDEVVVLVTGSRIPVPMSIRSTGPMQVVAAQDILLSGRSDAVDVLSALPQMVISARADYGNYSNPASGAGGFATADLRGLGPQRTVVLVNGRRLGLGDPNTANLSPAPDLDQIPLAMVERVEILTGGASATYGSDAIAGVVNFILRDDIEGIEVDGQYALAQHTDQDEYVRSRMEAAGLSPPTGTRVDGSRRDVSILEGSGIGEGEGHVTGWLIYHRQDPVFGADRDFTACSGLSTSVLTGDPTQPGWSCLTSRQSNRVVTSAGGDYSIVGNQFLPWPSAGSIPPPSFNPASYFSTQRQDDRYQAGILAHLDISRAATPYIELSFMEDRTTEQFAPSGIFVGGNLYSPDGTWAINCSNPLLSAQEAGILCTPAQIASDRALPGSVSANVDIARRNVEGQGREAYFRHQNYRAVAGVRGKLGEAWSYDAYATYAYTSLLKAYRNFLSTAAIVDALQVTTNASGAPVCISGGSCVPYNIFRSGGVTAQQLAYLSSVASDTGSNSEQIFEASVTGQLSRYGLLAPWARDGLAFNAGVDHRAESLRFAPDVLELSGDLAGLGAAPVELAKGMSATEGFVELRAPIAQDRRFIKSLTLDAGFRFSSYSTSGSNNTWKFGLQFAPIEDARLRATFERVVRAPNLIELYTPLSYSSSPVLDTDPCAPTDGGATRATATLAQCVHTGVTAAQYGNGYGPSVGGTNTIPQCDSGSCGVVSGGNPSLAPETANTWSLGLTLTPTAMPTLTGSIDYYLIHLTGGIATVPETVTLQQCLTAGDPNLCGQIIRAPSGALSGTTVAGGGYVLGDAVNTGAALISGIDLQLNYRQPNVARWGSISASLTGSWLHHWIATPYESAPSYDCAGLFGGLCSGGSVNPTWRHNLRVTWDTPWHLLLSAQWRFIGRTGFDNNSSQALLQYQEDGAYNASLTHIPNYSYLDLSAIWTLNRRLQLRAGVSNVFDKDPPFIPLDVSGATGNLNTFATYDLLGRNAFVTLRATF